MPLPLDNARHVVCSNQVLLDSVQHRVWEVSVLQQLDHENRV